MGEAGEVGMAGDTDFDRYLAARWDDLVAGLEAEGVAPGEARLAVAEVLLASRRGWSRRVRDEQVDVTVWADVRERAGLPQRSGEPVPHGGRSPDPGDGPEDWLDRARALRTVRRRRGVRRGAVAVAALAVLAAGWQWWASRPPPAEVREEVNALPVVWYSASELHLADVVVTLPGIAEFAPSGDAVVARLESGRVVQVSADGKVSSGGPTDALDDPPEAPTFIAITQYDVVLQSAPLPGGGWAYLLDSSRREAAAQQDALRQSESGRRALVLCDADLSCEAPRTIIESGGAIRLR
ncbi:hypothetical protein SAMN04489844_3362 [Nocardioides exalbidus]|uniref:Uncharacterized protein n=1 Tax=Nocardioides exalbidus TaxID=402596 RepID=A0A1H4WTV4_9ACTN|nr:hypothetical protein [Nocardioides exalbidus]SEC96822.1 hypothetical protein SAMN04489844_3362 [Nocardioides exalbidus]